MGSFYHSIQIYQADEASVRAAIAEACRGTELKLWVSPARAGWVCAFPSDLGLATAFATELSRRLSCPVLNVILHDSDVFAFELSHHGQLIDEYNSAPAYFGKVSDAEITRTRGHPAKIAAALGNAELEGKLTTLLARPSELEAETQMQLFMDLLGIRDFFCSYEYLEAGERDAVTDWKKYVHLPDRAAEQAARKAEVARQKTAKRQLIERGTLVADTELLRPRAIFRSAMVIGPDPESGGFLLTNLFRRNLWRWKPPDTPSEVAGGGARAAKIDALGYNLVDDSLRHELGASRIIRHPNQPLLFASKQRALVVLDEKTQRVTHQLEMINPQLVQKKAAQWRAAGLDPSTIPALDREDLLSFIFSPDGATIVAATSEGLRIYRTADILAAKEVMPLPSGGVETSRNLQDYRYAGGMLVIPARDDLHVLYVCRDESVRRFSCRQQTDIEVAAPIGDYAAFSLHRSGDGNLVASTMRGPHRDPRRRDDFIVRVWPWEHLAGALKL